MKRFIQTLTPYGNVPIDKIKIDSNELVFDFTSAEKLKLLSNEMPNEKVRLEDIAYLGLKRKKNIDDEVLCKIANQTGPLFALQKESKKDWVEAIMAAAVAVGIQDCINKKINSFSSISIIKYVGKPYRIKQNFYYYSLGFLCGNDSESEYIKMISDKTSFHNLSEKNSYSYVFISFDKIKDEKQTINVINIHLFMFKKEITEQDFDVMCHFYEKRADKKIDKEIVKMHRPQGVPKRLPSRHHIIQNETIAEESDIDIKNSVDRLALQNLVNAVITIHLQGIKLNLLCSTEGSDGMVFPNYLTYLWYAFSKRIGSVKIGFCRICGKPFSITNRRGLPKSYCSDECRTKAKNERVKDRRDSIRTSFSDGVCVKDIVNNGENKNIDAAETVSKWKVCKYAIYDSIQLSDSFANDFLDRLIKEGIVTLSEINAYNNKIHDDYRIKNAAIDRLKSNKSPLQNEFSGFVKLYCPDIKMLLKID